MQSSKCVIKQHLIVSFVLDIVKNHIQNQYVSSYCSLSIAIRMCWEVGRKYPPFHTKFPRVCLVYLLCSASIHMVCSYFLVHFTAVPQTAQAATFATHEICYHTTPKRTTVSEGKPRFPLKKTKQLRYECTNKHIWGQERKRYRVKVANLIFTKFPD